MDFLNPLFLVGLLAGAIPIVIHLINRRRAVRRPFPALEFLRRSQKKIDRRLKVRQIVLLALRVAALAFVAMAMAKPYFVSEAGVTDAERLPTAVAFVVDDSASMGYGDGKVWDTAVQVVEDRLDKMRPWDQAVLVYASDWPAGAPLGEDIPLSEFTDDHQAVLDALEEHRPSERSTDLPQALRTAADLLAHSELQSRRIVLVTDRQKSGFDERQLPEGGLGAPIELLDVRTDEEHANLAITGVSYRQQSAGARPEFAIIVEVMNHSDQPRKGVEVQLQIDGLDVGSGLVDLEPRKTGTTTFVHRFDEKGIHRARVTLAKGTDSLAADNTFWLPIHLAQQVRVLLVNGDPRSVAWQDELFYLDKALVPSARSRSGIVTESISVAGLAGREFSEFDVVVLANVEKMPRASVAELTRFVNDGGGVLITCGRLVSPERYNDLFKELLPKPLRSVKQLARADDPDAEVKVTRFGTANQGHPIFKVFNLPGGETLQSVRVYSYMLLQPTTDDDAQLLLSYGDGAPALLEKQLGKGRVAMLTTTIDRDWTDLPIRTSFLPLTRRLVRHLGRRGTTNSQTNYQVAAKATLDVPLDVRGRVEVRDPEARRIVLTPESAEPGAPLAFVPKATGHYRVMVAPEVGEGEPVELPEMAFAVNIDQAESDLTAVPKDNFVTLLSRGPSGEGEGSGAVVDTPEKRVGLWSLLLFIVTIVLLAETILGTRRSVLKRLYHMAIGRRRMTVADLDS